MRNVRQAILLPHEIFSSLYHAKDASLFASMLLGTPRVFWMHVALLVAAFVCKDMQAYWENNPDLEAALWSHWGDKASSKHIYRISMHSGTCVHHASDTLANLRGCS